MGEVNILGAIGGAWTWAWGGTTEPNDDGGELQESDGLPTPGGCLTPEEGGMLGRAPCKDDMDGNCINGTQTTTKN